MVALHGGSRQETTGQARSGLRWLANLGLSMPHLENGGNYTRRGRCEVCGVIVGSEAAPLDDGVISPGVLGERARPSRPRCGRPTKRPQQASYTPAGRREVNSMGPLLVVQFVLRASSILVESSRAQPFFGGARDLAWREPRTVSVLRESFGRAAGYSAPPMLPKIRCPRGISSIAFEGIRSPRSSPVMVLPFSLAMGAYTRSASCPAASHCHPRLTTV